MQDGCYRMMSRSRTSGRCVPLTRLVPSPSGSLVTNLWHPSSRALNTRERFIWPCIRRLGRPVHQRNDPHHLSLSQCRPQPWPCLDPSRPHPTSRRFIHNTLTDNPTLLRSTSGHSQFSLLTARWRYRCSTSTTSTPTNKRPDSSYSAVAGLGPTFSMNRSPLLLPASNTSE